MSESKQTTKPKQKEILQYGGEGYLEIPDLKLTVQNGDTFECPSELASRLAAYGCTPAEGAK